MNKRDKQTTNKNTSIDKIHQPTIQIVNSRRIENNNIDSTTNLSKNENINISIDRIKNSIEERKLLLSKENKIDESNTQLSYDEIKLLKHNKNVIDNVLTDKSLNKTPSKSSETTSDNKKHITLQQKYNNKFISPHKYNDINNDNDKPSYV
jgi:hypothetical protein